MAHAREVVGTVTSRFRVSAIVSAFKSERFLRGCLENLEAQTIADALEIVVVNSGSPEGEHEIVSEFLGRYDNIVYVRTPWTESVYAAWNRAIMMSSGEYITNANTDDRHRNDAFEIMSKALDANPKAGLAYAGYVTTEVENETFASTTSKTKFMPLDYRRDMLLQGYCFPGPMPMWRESVHREFGMFDERFVSAGDIEFWMRISAKYPFVRVPKTLGLYLSHPESIEHRSGELAQREAASVVAAYSQAGVRR